MSTEPVEVNWVADGRRQILQALADPNTTTAVRAELTWDQDSEQVIATVLAAAAKVLTIPTAAE